MRIGIMSFAHHHAEAYIHNLRLLDGVELIGIADDDQERGRAYAQRNDTQLYRELPGPAGRQAGWRYRLFREREPSPPGGDGGPGRRARAV